MGPVLNHDVVVHHRLDDFALLSHVHPGSQHAPFDAAAIPEASSGSHDAPRTNGGAMSQLGIGGHGVFCAIRHFPVGFCVDLGMPDAHAVGLYGHHRPPGPGSGFHGPFPVRHGRTQGIGFPSFSFASGAGVGFGRVMDPFDELRLAEHGQEVSEHASYAFVLAHQGHCFGRQHGEADGTWFCTHAQPSAVPRLHLGHFGEVSFLGDGDDTIAFVDGDSRRASFVRRGQRHGGQCASPSVLGHDFGQRHVEEHLCRHQEHVGGARGVRCGGPYGVGGSSFFVHRHHVHVHAVPLCVFFAPGLDLRRLSFSCHDHGRFPHPRFLELGEHACEDGGVGHVEQRRGSLRGLADLGHGCRRSFRPHHGRHTHGLPTLSRFHVHAIPPTRTKDAEPMHRRDGRKGTEPTPNRSFCWSMGCVSRYNQDGSPESPPVRRRYPQTQQRVVSSLGRDRRDWGSPQLEKTVGVGSL
eukprot:scaffold126_cov315-Pavlova_lutheri.AAC.31